MSIIRRARKQYAVYWEKIGDDKNGTPIYAAPVEIRCRWDDMQEEYLDSKGRMNVSSAIVMVDRVVTLGGVLWRGRLAAIETAEVPKDNPGAYEIRKYNETPNLRNTETLREAVL
jgi:hypothetical protein